MQARTKRRVSRHVVDAVILLLEGVEVGLMEFVVASCFLKEPKIPRLNEFIPTCRTIALFDVKIVNCVCITR
jgi:hypothetical protein